MTREEAKEVLDDMKVKIDIPKSAVTQHKRNEALDMAISALSENKGDLISRQAVLDAIFSEPLYKTGMKKRGAEEAVTAIFEKIKALPSAENKGEWIPFSEELPPKGKKVHVSTFGIVTIGERTSEANEALRLSILEPMNNMYKNVDPYSYQITRWQPLPEPHKTEKGG